MALLLGIICNKWQQSEGGAAFITGDGKVAFKSQAASETPSSVTTYRYNLCLNPNFANNNNNWNGTRVSTVAYKGTYSLQGGSFTQWDVQSPVVPDTLYGALFTDSATTWVQNTAYTFSVWVYSTAAQSVTLTAGFKRSSGVKTLMK